MAETINYLLNATLTPELTSALIKGSITPLLVEQVQTATNAYFPFDKDTFGGVLSHPPGGGPEKPYFRPEGDDWRPEVQAIAQIGVQYYYWQMLYQGLVKRTLDPGRLFAMEMLVLYPNQNGSASVDLDSHPDRLKYVAKALDDAAPRFPAYIPTVNCGGDADFYGVDYNGIFPMKVKTPDETRSYVQREQLGLRPEIVDKTWKSWENLYPLRGKIYHQIVIDLLVKGLLPSNVEDVIKQDLEVGEKFCSEGIVTRSLIKHGIYDENELGSAIDILRKHIRRLISNKDYRALTQAAKNHADNLNKMYFTAASFRADVYRCK